MRLITIAASVLVCAMAMADSSATRPSAQPTPRAAVPAAKEPMIRNDAPQNVRAYWDECQQMRQASVADAIVDATVAHLPQVVADMVHLQRLTGMRSGELCGLTWARVDKSGPVWIYVPAKHKTSHKGKIRVVAIGPRAQAILSAYASRPAALPVFSASEAMKQRWASLRANARHPAKKSRAKVGARPIGEGFDPRSYAKAIKYAAGQAKVVHWHPHQLRHASATGTYIALGEGHAQASMGHGDAETTMIYVDRDAQLKQQIAKAVEVALKVG